MRIGTDCGNKVISHKDKSLVLFPMTVFFVHSLGTLSPDWTTVSLHTQVKLSYPTENRSLFF